MLWFQLTELQISKVMVLSDCVTTRKQVAKNLSAYVACRSIDKDDNIVGILRRALKQPALIESYPLDESSIGAVNLCNLR